MKRYSVFFGTLAMGLLSAMSVFAQHQGGTSGPDNSTYSNHNPLATNDTVLTHVDLAKAVQSCMEQEALRLVRILSKNNEVMLVNPNVDVANLSYDPTHDGYIDSTVGFRLAESAAQPNYTDASFSYIGFPGLIGIYQSFRVSLSGTFPNAPFQNLDLQLPIEMPSLRWKETLLPDAVDEYGRVREDKSVVTDLHWISVKFNSQSGFFEEQAPALNRGYALYNCNSSYGGLPDSTNPYCRAVKGVEFDMESYSSCINSKTGIH